MIYFIYFFIILVLVTNGFSYNYWNVPVSFLYVLSVIALLNVLFSYKKIKRKECNFSNEILCLTFFPLLSSISAYLIYNQSVKFSFTLWLPNLILFIYFICHINNFRGKQILNLIALGAVIIVIIQIVQQLSPGIAMFGLANRDEIEMRNGLYRYRMGNVPCAILIAFYYWVTFLQKKKLTSLIWTLFMLISIYLTLTRQILFSTLLTLVYSFFMLNKKNRMKNLIILCIFLGIIYGVQDILFGSLIKQTNESDLSDDNIRLLATDFYWEKIIESPLTFILGSGTPHGSTSFGRMFYDYWQEKLHFYTSDIGIVGMWWHYGIIYISVYFSLLYKILIKYRKNIDLYIRLFVISTGLISVMIYPFFEQVSLWIWPLMLYLTDKQIIASKNNERIISLNRNSGIQKGVPCSSN